MLVKVVSSLRKPLCVCEGESREEKEEEKKVPARRKLFGARTTPFSGIEGPHGGTRLERRFGQNRLGDLGGAGGSGGEADGLGGEANWVRGRAEVGGAEE